MLDLTYLINLTMVGIKKLMLILTPHPDHSAAHQNPMTPFRTLTPKANKNLE